MSKRIHAKKSPDRISSILPKRYSLTASTVFCLRAAIARRRWGDYLPGERLLSAELNISRPILRAALAILTKEGLLKKMNRSRTKILSKRVSREPRTADRICILSPVALRHLSPSIMFSLMNELSIHSRSAGLRVEFLMDQRLSNNVRTETLHQIVHRQDVALWVIIQSSLKIQKYFSSLMTPSIVLGHRFPGISLPAIDRDNRATARHCVGQFVRRGHRRIGLLNPEIPTAGDLARKDGFFDAVNECRKMGVTGHLIPVPGNPRKFLDQIHGSLTGKNRPTALLVNDPQIVVPLFCFLNSQDRTVPAHMSLIVAEDDPILDLLPLRIAHYSHKKLIKLFCRHAVAQAMGSRHDNFQRLIIPEFVPGDSLGTAPSIART